MSELIAEVMSVGDEIISGQRLDTNSQWISRELGEIGISVRFHSSVGDELADHVAALKIAIERADIVLMTGGLGPTADDLTRVAIAQAVGSELELDPTVLETIQAIFQRFGRPMPANNESQAWFPEGSRIIPNPEGTAPGIDYLVRPTGKRPARIFALPGVPVEMKQMWMASVLPELRTLSDDANTFHFHTLNCFGAGESTIETMLPDLVQRGRDPKVGITASAATITLRVSTRGTSVAACREKMQPTIDTIRTCLGELIFGENDEDLIDVVLKRLRQTNLTIGIAEDGWFEELTQQLIGAPDVFLGVRSIVSDLSLAAMAQEARTDFQSKIGIAVSPLELDESLIVAGKSNFTVAIAGPQGDVVETFRFGGHSQWRQQRAAKQVLNCLRLYLLRMN